MRRKGLVALCLLLVFLTLTSCVVGRGARGFSFQNEIHQSGVADPALHTGNPGALRQVAASDDARLLIDDTTLNIAYADAFSDRLWMALPAQSNTLASLLSAVLISPSGRYYLNSQDNAAAFGTVSVAETENGADLTFTMAENADAAAKEPSSLTEGEPYLRVTLSLSVEDGKLSALIDHTAVYVAEGFVLEKLSVLPYFGAIGYPAGVLPTAEEPEEAEVDTEAGEEPVVAAGNPAAETNDMDYLVLPDGCGALLYTARQETAGANFSFETHTGDGVNSPYVPAAVFGVKNGGDAFVCAVTAGDAAATVRALNLSNENSIFNIAYPEFLITDAVNVGSRVLFGTSYTGAVRLVYKFLTGSSADYISMAIAAGEELIRAGILPRAQITDAALPLNVGVLCTADGTKETAAADFAQAEDLLRVLKGKGVTCANILLQGIFSDGLAHTAFSSFRPLGFLGGRRGLDELGEYAAKQGLDLYAGVNLLAAKKSDAAVGPDGAALLNSVSNPLFPVYGNRYYNLNLLREDKISKVALRLLNAADSLSLPGLCVNDAAVDLYEDFRHGVGRAGVKAAVGEELSAISAGKKLAMNGADLGSVKNASLITSLPLDAYFETDESDHYAGVPFFPAMLHGSVIYSGFPVNEQPTPYLYLLKTVEYGGAPYYEWTCAADSALYYETSMAEALDFLSGMNEKLGDLISEPISGHAKLRDGVYQTMYENGAAVFVNYNNYSVNINSISVAPYSYLRLN